MTLHQYNRAKILATLPPAYSQREIAEEVGITERQARAIKNGRSYEDIQVIESEGVRKANLIKRKRHALKLAA